MARLTKQEKAEQVQRLRDLELKALRNVTLGKCPECGAGLKRNLSLVGWWQCEQYGAIGFRKDDNKPACSYQCFTE